MRWRRVQDFMAQNCVRGFMVRAFSYGQASGAHKCGVWRGGVERPQPDLLFCRACGLARTWEFQTSSKSPTKLGRVEHFWLNPQLSRTSRFVAEAWNEHRLFCWSLPVKPGPQSVRPGQDPLFSSCRKVCESKPSVRDLCGTERRGTGAENGHTKGSCHWGLL